MGNVNISIWENEVKSRNGTFKSRSVTIQRSYQKEGKWENTNSLRNNDIPKAVLLLQKAYEENLVKSEGEEDGE